MQPQPRSNHPGINPQHAADFTISSTVEGRGFLRFDAFAAELLRLQDRNSIQMAADLYPGISKLG